MKIISRTWLKPEIVVDKKTYRVDQTQTELYRNNKESLLLKSCILVLILDRKLDGKTDVHGKPYKATKWIYKRVNK